MTILDILRLRVVCIKRLSKKVYITTYKKISLTIAYNRADFSFPTMKLQYVMH